MSDPLVEYLRTCCVHVLGERPGCGFFIAPQLVVTCSHVVGRERKDGEDIKLEKWDQGGGFSPRFAATVWRNFPVDDIAFIQTSDPNPTYAPLSGKGARSGHQLTALGFPKEGEQYVFDQSSVSCEGETLKAQAITLVKFKAGQVKGGFSGGPLLNLNTCRVMGVVRLTRDDRSAQGGWAVETPVLERLLRENGIELPNTDPNWTDAEVKQRGDSSAGTNQLTPELLRDLFQNPGQSERIEQLSLSLGENRYAIRLAIRSLGEAEAHIPDEMLALKLTESVKAYERQLSDLAVLRSDDSEIENKYKRARLALESDNPEGADASFGEAAELAKARARDAEALVAKAKEVRESGLIEAAEATAQRGQLAMARLAYLAAAQYFAEAADLLPNSMVSRSLEYRQQQAFALYRYGDEQGDNVILRQAIETYKSLLQSCSRDLTPLDWARTQSSLGSALATLGNRESGTERLEEAVTAHRAALKERRRERVPLDWARTQSSLGSALATLGNRESGTERLEEAVTAHRAALEEYRRERVPLDWARTQSSLGSALRVLGERESGTERLEEAVTAFRAALEEYRRERVPLDWARTQSSLGSALRVLGERESGTERLEEAVTAFRAALEEYRRERVPLDWAMTQNSLGSALATLGNRESGTERLEEAVTAYRAALKERRRERVPLDWARTQNCLGSALATLGERESGTERLEEAVTAHRAALKERRRERVPLDWARTQSSLGSALATLGNRESGTERLEEAVTAHRAALEEYRRERVPLDWARTQNNLGNALAMLGNRESGTERLEEAVTAFRAALKERRRERVPLNWAMTQSSLGSALRVLGERESGTERLEEAVTAHRAALEEYRRERVPLKWAMTQTNLGNALATLGGRNKDRSCLKQAKSAIEQAFSVFREAGYQQYNEDFAQRLNDIDQALDSL